MRSVSNRAQNAHGELTELFLRRLPTLPRSARRGLTDFLFPRVYLSYSGVQRGYQWGREHGFVVYASYMTYMTYMSYKNYLSYEKRE